MELNENEQHANIADIEVFKGTARGNMERSTTHRQKKSQCRVMMRVVIDMHEVEANGTYLDTVVDCLNY